jgi:hypothetical protein
VSIDAEFVLSEWIILSLFGVCVPATCCRGKKTDRQPTSFVLIFSHIQFELDSFSFYFINNNRDMEILQRAVLTTEFHHGPSNTLPIRVLIIDRAKKSRHWLYAAETKTQLKAIWGNDGEVIVKIVSNPGGTLLKQARLFHSADIIISSHGAQLTNLAFIRPCTVVVEIFPYAYYMGFFQTLVLAAEGIAFDANPFDSSPRVDTQRNSNEKHMRRSVGLQASPASVVHAFPRLLLELMTCRRNWKGEEGL